MEDKGWRMEKEGVRVAIIRGFRDLNVYRMAVREAKRIFEISGRFPPEERYSLTDQIRRASRAVAGMIAEAWARRRYPAAFANKLDEAMAESAETQAWLDHALECGYISPAELRTLDAGWQSIGAKLNRMIERTDDFCRTAAGTR